MTAEVLTRFTTAIIRNSLTYTKTLADLRAALAVSDICCTQEMGRRNAAKLAGVAWGTAQGKRGSQARTAIHWRKDRFVEVAWGNPLLHVSSLFPSATRYYTWVRLKDLASGRKWMVVNVHMVPHADDDAGRLTRFPRRHLVVAAIQILLTFARATRGQLVVMGDFNTNLKADLETADPETVAARFRGVGLVSSVEILGLPRRGTHGKNLYDQIYFRNKRRVYRLVDHQVHEKRNSDHRAYTVDAMVSVREKGRRRGC